MDLAGFSHGSGLPGKTSPPVPPPPVPLVPYPSLGTKTDAEATELPMAEQLPEPQCWGLERVKIAACLGISVILEDESELCQVLSSSLQVH